MAITISGSTGVTYPSGGVDNVAGAGVGTTDTQTLTNKTLTTPNIDSAQFATVSGTAPIYPCRAWVNFNGTGTVAIRASGNVTSITDNGTGDYTLNFTTAMADANYAASGGCGDDGATNDRVLNPVFNNTPTTSALRTRTTSSNGTPQDVSRVTLQVIR
jgi:hypothetical protein